MALTEPTPSFFMFNEPPVRLGIEDGRKYISGRCLDPIF